MSTIQNYYSTNYTTCSKCDTFLCSSQVFTTLGYSLSVIAMPFYILGGYCILRKSPSQMGNYKGPLFNFHFWSCFVDILYNTLVAPYLMYPALAGIPYGLFEKIGMPVVIQLWIGIFSINLMVMSITILFENRYNSIPFNKHKISGKILKPVYYTVRVLIGVFFSSILFLYLPENQEAALLEILKTIPCPTEEYFKNLVFVLVVDKNYIRLLGNIMGISFPIELIQMTYFNVYCIYYLFFSSSKFTSAKTKKLQISFFRSIILQVSIPVLFLIPIFVIMTTSVAFGYYDQALTNYTIIHASLHGLLSTYTILAIHKPYRDFIFSKFRKPALVEASKRSVTSRKSLNVFATAVIN